MKCDIHENNVDEIIPYLWLGDVISSQHPVFLKKYKIKCIIRVMPDNNLVRYSDIKYIDVPIKDTDACLKDNSTLFNQLTDIIHQYISNKIPVLVHCKRGHHRSATVVAAYLIKYCNYQYLHAIKFINSIRPCALNRGNCMMKGLYEFYTDFHNLPYHENSCQKEGRYSRCDLKLK